MGTDWQSLRQTCEQLDPGSVVRTPLSERLFEVEATSDEEITVRFRDSGEVRSLRREQFGLLTDRLDDGPLPFESLTPDVEPYVALLSLSPQYVSDEVSLSRDAEHASGGASPHLVSADEARTPPERVHDDAILLANLLEELETADLSAVDTETLTDLYVLLSDVERGASQFRRSASDVLVDRLGADQQTHSLFGTVRRTTRERRYPKDDEVVLDALDEHGIPHEWVLGVDPGKLDVVLAVTDMEERDVYDVSEQVYVMKTDVDQQEKFSRLQGLAARIQELEGGEELQEDLVDLERRLDEAISTG